MMDLDLIYKIVCEKGMNIHIRPAVMYEDHGDTIFISLTKGEKKIAFMVPFYMLLKNADPEKIFADNINLAIEKLEKGELND